VGTIERPGASVQLRTYERNGPGTRGSGTILTPVKVRSVGSREPTTTIMTPGNSPRAQRRAVAQKCSLHAAITTEKRRERLARDCSVLRS
jgi:hypothetical protein